MATERDLELLDDYMANRLAGNEKTSFENRLQADPDLKNEYNFQQQLVEGIKSARAKELKTLLNNTPVPPVSYGGSIGARFAVGTVIVGAIATGLYLYFNPADKTRVDEPTESVQSPQAEPSEQRQNPVQDEPSEQNDAVSSEKQEGNNDVTRRKETSQTKQAPVEQPVIEVFDPTEEAKAEDDAAASDESPRTTATQPASTIAVEVEKNHRSYSFHYQFKQGSLFLYGPFEKNLYEILEFFSDDKRTVFLFYKDSFYLLAEDDEKIKPLTAITDPKLINKLKEYRKN